MKFQLGNRRSKLLLLGVLVGVLSLFSQTPTAFAQIQDSPVIDIDDFTMEPGQTIDVPIILQAGTATVGIAWLDLVFDNYVVSATDCVQSTPNGLSVCNIVNDDGIVQLVTIDTIEGSSGDILLATITFAAIGAGGDATALSIENAEVGTTAGTDIAIDVHNGSIILTGSDGGFTCADVNEIPIAECMALVAIYNSNSDVQSSLLGGWLETNTPCSWNRVECRDGHVVALDFSTIDAGLRVLPPQIENLTKLESLNLLFNALSTLPPEFGNLTALTNLSLEGNNLTVLPSEFGDLSSLQSVNLAQNSLSSLPPEIGDLSNLTTLIVAANELTSLPIEIARLTSLAVLNANNNPLENLPVHIDVAIEGNGTVNRRTFGPELGNRPAGLFYMPGTSIKLFGTPDAGWQYETVSCENDVDAVRYGVTIVVELGAQNANCTIVFIEQIPFSGCADVSKIPQAECEALVAIYNANPSAQPNLTDWFTSDNPCEWGMVVCSEADELASITRLFLSGTQLMSLPPEIGTLTSLWDLRLTGNQLTSLPPEIGTLTSLEELHVPHNQLTSLPSEIGTLTSLEELYISHNQLATLPPEIGTLTSLEELYISYNQLATLPPEIGTLTSLKNLKLNENRLASLPPEIGNLSALVYLEIIANQLATLPPEIGTLTSLEELYISYNQLATLPPEIGTLTSLEELHVPHNQLTSLPSEIGTLTSLEKLSLYENMLTSLPAEIENLFATTRIYLYYNSLQSGFPAKIEVNINGIGNVERNEPGPFYVAGTNVQLTAVPAQGWTLQSSTCQNVTSFIEFEDGVALTVGEQNATCTIVFTPSSTTCGPLMQEAEAGVRFGYFELVDDGAASGGQSVYVPRSRPSLYAGPDGVNHVTFCMDLPEEGRYRIKADTSAPDTEADSFYVLVDGDFANSYLWDIPRPSDFSSSYVSDRAGMNPVELDLSAGQHTVTFALRESGTKLDKVALELVESFEPPVGSCDGLEREAEDGFITGDFAIIDDGSASGGKAVRVPEGNGHEWNGANSLRKVDYCFTVADEGSYYIKSWSVGADDLSDSFYVRVNNEPTSAYVWDLMRSSTYSESFVSGRFGPKPVAVNLSPGVHYVSIYAREDGTTLDKLALVPESGPAEPLACGGMMREAEEGALSGGFEIGNDGAASGGQYIHVPNGGGDEWNGTNALRKAEYCFTVEQAGTYTIKANVYGESDLDDSFYVRVNGESEAGFLWDTLINSDYAEDYVGDRTGADPVTISLAAGEHTVSIYLREDGTRLDKLALEPVASLNATSLPQAASTAPLAMGVRGEVLLQNNSSISMIGRDAVDFTRFSITLVDAATGGEQYSRTIALNADGGYRLEGMPVGDYLFTFDAPAEYSSTLPNALPVSLDASRVLRLSPDVVPQQVNQLFYMPIINR